jgi:hypothetical protein
MLYTETDVHYYNNSLTSSQNENFLDKSFEKINTRILYSIKFPFFAENCAFYQTM